MSYSLANNTNSSNSKQQAMMFNLFAVFFLIFGFLNPVRGNIVDEMVALFLFCFVSVVFFLPGKLEMIRRLAIVVVIICFLISSFATSGDVRKMLSRDLPLYTYSNDPGVFLKTYQFMRGGTDYYLAFYTAQNGTFSGARKPADIWWFRMPTIFYIWSYLPGNGLQIYFLFLFLCCLSLYSAFKITSRFTSSRIGLLSAYLIFSYLHYGARDQMLLETEWWGVMLFIIGLFFFLYKKYFWAVVLFSLSVLVRELFLMPIMGMLLVSLFYQRKHVLIFIIPILAFGLLFLFHIQSVSGYFSSYLEMFKPRISGDGLLLVKQTLAFGSWEYLFFRLRPFVLFLVCAVLGVIYLVKNKRGIEGLYILCAFVIFPVAFLKIGSVPFNDYWGIMYVPLILIFAPMLLGFFRKIEH